MKRKLDEVSDNQSQENSFYEPIFAKIVNHIIVNHVNLLNAKELEVIKRYQNLTNDARRLFVRLFLRKPKWIPISKLNYSEISDLMIAKKDLVVNNFVKDGNSFVTLENHMKLDDVFEISALEELKVVAKPFLKVTGTSKTELVEKLRSILTKQRTLFGSSLVNKFMVTARKSIGEAIQLNPDILELFKNLQVAYFCNTRFESTSMKEEILRMIQKTKFANYIMDTTSVFRDRTHLIDYCMALQLENQFQVAQQEKDVDIQEGIFQTVYEQWKYLLSSIICHESHRFLKVYEPFYVFTRILDMSTVHLAKMGRFDEEVSLLESLLDQKLYYASEKKRGKWWDRLLLVKEKLARKEKEKDEKLSEVIQIGMKAIADNIDLTSQNSIMHRLQRLSKSTGLLLKDLPVLESLDNISTTIIYADRAKLVEKGSKSSWLSISNFENETCNVEERVIQHYAMNGNWRGMHAETSLPLTLFALLFWPVIFHNVPRVFQNEFQDSPLDIRSDDFYLSRKSLIDDRIEQIKNGEAVDILKQCYEEHYGTQCIGLNWEFDLDDVVEILCLMNPTKLAQLMQLFTSSYHIFSSGFPDLCLWKTNELKFVEVKGPGDHLMMNQKCWIKELQNIGFIVEVCLVKCSFDAIAK